MIAPDTDKEVSVILDIPTASKGLNPVSIVIM
jgi:hypothetical protein